jgi:hypothetical protein
VKPIPLLNPLKSCRDTLVALHQRSRWPHLIIHRPSLTRLPGDFAVPLLCGPVRGKLRCPPDLTILLIHDHPDETVAERSLRFGGIDDFTVVRPSRGDRWTSTLRLRLLADWLARDCDTEFVLFFDSDDAVIRDQPARAIDYLRDADADLLFSDTGFRGGYCCMPEVQRWADAQARQAGRRSRYINAGVFVARSDFLGEVLDAALAYVTDDDLARREFFELMFAGKLCDRLPDFPRGSGSDQEIFRFLQPRFHPRMQVDYSGRFALRRIS